MYATIYKTCWSVFLKVERTFSWMLVTHIFIAVLYFSPDPSLPQAYTEFASANESIALL